MLLSCWKSRAVYAREEDKTGSEVLRSDDEKSSPRTSMKRLLSTSGGQARGRRQFALNAIASTRRVPNNRATFVRCPPFKSFESLQRCVYHASSPYQRILQYLCLYHIPLLTASRPSSSLHQQPHHLSRAYPSKQELPHHQAKPRQHKAKMFVYKRGMSSSMPISNIFKSLEAIGSTADELATPTAERLDHGHVSTRIY